VLANSPIDNASLKELQSLLKAATLPEDQAFLNSLLRASSVRRKTEPVAMDNLVVPTMVQDLRLRGGGIDLGLLAGIQPVYDLGQALRDARQARGAPALIQVIETNAQVAGAAVSLGYTVPLQRQARIDYVSVRGLDTTLNRTDDGTWAFANILVDPLGAGSINLEGDVISLGNTFTPGPKQTVFNGRLYLNPTDVVSSSMIARVIDPAAVAWSMITGIFGIEIDVGYGWGEFS